MAWGLSLRATLILLCLAEPSSCATAPPAPCRVVVVVVQSLSHVQLFATLWTEHAKLPCLSLPLFFGVGQTHGFEEPGRLQSMGLQELDMT